MTSRAVAFAALVAAIGFLGAAVVPAWAEGGDEAALAAAMKNASATLQGGLKASEAQGTPISAKFEIEDGKLQLSVYTIKGSDFIEILADPNTGAITKAENTLNTDAAKLDTFDFNAWDTTANRFYQDLIDLYNRNIDKANKD